VQILFILLNQRFWGDGWGDFVNALSLLDCLKLAAVSDRQGIKDRLFLPLE